MRLGSIRIVGILYGYLLYCVVQFYFVELTLFACVWRWSCNAWHESRWCCKCCRWSI